MHRLVIALAGLGLITAPAAPAEQAVRFETTTVEPEAVDRIRTAPGTIEARNRARLSAEVSGTVQGLPFDVGDTVDSGAVLVRLDDADLKARMEVAQASLAAAEARLQEARQSFQRTKNLYEQDSASEQQMDQATAALDQAEARRSQAQAEIRKLEIRLAKTTIRAPFDGVVVAKHIDSGELAQPGTPLISVLDSARLRLMARVQESRIPDLMGDGPATIHVPALDRRFDAKRITIVPQGDEQTHTFQVRLRLPQAAPASAGMFGRAEFHLGTFQSLMVPERAIVRRSEITGVYVVADGRVSFRLVELGEAKPQGREVLAGLEAGERIALEPEQALRHLKERQVASQTPSESAH
ncbi:efflux RND transporter periplasmic adaptor subunit [Thiohalorhabdus sp.]|uniref:efflux RND transporter periplasmic adaptor subunit n=1 Tax=Thiohalorhabdus sp. TaxID=3094134 RepID=UPI002FC317FC